MFLFILESIGTQELILIAAVALIVFGPRKLPQIAKTIGKTMAEFRNATSEFKSTWEKEVAFEEEAPPKPTSLAYTSENTIARGNTNVEQLQESEDSTKMISAPLTPEIKELSAEEVAKLFPNQENQSEKSNTEETQTETISIKRDWL